MTTATVIPFPTSNCVARHVPDEQLVRNLEVLTRMARTGELTSFYGFGFLSDGCGASVLHDGADFDTFKTLGGFDRLTSRYRQKHDL